MMVRFVFIIFLLGQQQLTHAQECNVSKPNLVDPKGAIRSNELFGWFGSEKLAALIPHNGRWVGMGKEHGYRDKFWWWHSGFDARSRSEEFLSLTVENLESGETFTLNNATNASTGSDNYEWNSMLFGMEFPSAGCWQITGIHKEQNLVKWGHKCK